MNPAIASMLERYPRSSADDHVNALREILQEITLCGLWRAKFSEHAAFYGGTALRVLYGLDRFSEDIDFSLLAPADDFDLKPYCAAVEGELSSWGFPTTVEAKKKTARSAVESAFLKANTRQLLLTIEAGEIASAIHGRRELKIKLEMDTDPPPGFSTETKFLLRPIPFSVKAYDPPSLLAGKMHAVLCRRWGTRVKGRDWYDLAWYVGRDTPLNLAHLEARMRQSGHFSGDGALEEELRAWGFPATVEVKRKTARSAVESAFLKANTRQLLLTIEAGDAASAIHGRRELKIKLEVDTDPPPGFSTETRFLLQPIPFSVKAYAPPSLFAGKMHAVLCRGWGTRVKGRDWYDLVWYVGRGTALDLEHLEARMRQSGHYDDHAALDESAFRSLLAARIDDLDVAAARSEVERFLVDPATVRVWSREFFESIAKRISVRG